jgi:hypothetical protein
MYGEWSIGDNPELADGPMGCPRVEHVEEESDAEEAEQSWSQAGPRARGGWARLRGSLRVEEDAVKKAVRKVGNSRKRLERRARAIDARKKPGGSYQRASALVAGGKQKQFAP